MTSKISTLSSLCLISFTAIASTPIVIVHSDNSQIASSDKPALISPGIQSKITLTSTTDISIGLKYEPPIQHTAPVIKVNKKPAKYDIPKVETVKTGIPKADTTNIETVKTDMPKAETTNIEAVKTGIPKADITNIEAAKTGIPKAETTNIEAVKTGIPKAETTNIEAVKTDTSLGNIVWNVVRVSAGILVISICFFIVLQVFTYIRNIRRTRTKQTWFNSAN